MHPTIAGKRGFTLIEIALVLVIVTILMTTIAVPIAGQLRQKRISETQKMLDLAQQALIGYASSNGRLPCPATDGTTVGNVNSFGEERFATGESALTGKCEYWAGFLPAVSLGLGPLDSQGFLVDAWGHRANRIRYVVWGSTVVTFTNTFFPFTQSGGMKLATTAALADPGVASTFLLVCQAAPTGSPLPSAAIAGAASACGATGMKLADHAPAVIYSLGENAAAGAAGADELINLKTTASQNFAFVSHTPTAGPANAFDDLVNWISLSVLVNNMQVAGKLP
ncbi:MAG: type II secretion system protein [Betaproteobacteria bacterium]